MSFDFISLGNELKPEQENRVALIDRHFISLGNELKPEPEEEVVRVTNHFISLGNELKPELLPQFPALR